MDSDAIPVPLEKLCVLRCKPRNGGRSEGQQCRLQIFCSATRCAASSDYWALLLSRDSYKMHCEHGNRERNHVEYHAISAQAQRLSSSPPRLPETQRRQS